MTTNNFINQGDIHTCFDRYNPGTLQKHKWENAMVNMNFKNNFKSTYSSFY